MDRATELYQRLLMDDQIDPLPPDEPVIVRDNPRYRQLRPGVGQWNLDGVKVSNAPAPPLFHRHWAQTVFNLPVSDERWRCPCGASRDPYGAWYQQEWHVTDKRRWKGLWS